MTPTERKSSGQCYLVTGATVEELDPMLESHKPQTTADSTIRIRLFFWILGASLALSQAWLSRLDMVNDTISYLDMGEHFFRGHPWSIINGLWSPLYAVCLGFLLFIFKPSLYWEYPLVHLFLFFVFLLTMACFDYFLGQLNKLRSLSGAIGEDSGLASVWIAIGYTIFLWSSLQYIGVDETNPDMIIAAFFYLICGLLTKIATGSASKKVFLAFGVALGLSYLTKSVMLPLSVLILGIAFLVAKKRARYVAVSAIVFIMISGPFIAALSAKKGRFTSGESGPYNYAVHVNQIPVRHWQGDGHVHLLHPTHQIFVRPDTFEFAGPLEGTYPVWYDPSFWYEGVKPYFNTREQVKTLARNLFAESETLFFALNGALVAMLLLMFFVGGRKWIILKDVSKYWFLVLPSLTALVLYALVHLEPRYIASFYTVLTLSVLSSVVFPDGFPKHRFLSGAVALLLLMFSSLTAFPTLLSLTRAGKTQKPFYPALLSVAGKTQKPSYYQEVAEGAYKMGLRQGDSIASLNMSNLGMAMWAHLARVRIIAEVYYWQPGENETLANSFWHADPSTQKNVLEVLSRTGAKAVISQDEPTGKEAADWLEIGATGYYLHWLKSAAETNGEGSRAGLSNDK
jgi:hypothetical protein